MKKTNIITIILAILVIGLTGYIVYDKVLSKEETPNNNINQNNTNNGEENEDEVNSLKTIKTYAGCIKATQILNKQGFDYGIQGFEYAIYKLELKEEEKCVLHYGGIDAASSGSIMLPFECTNNNSYIAINILNIPLYFKVNNNDTITYQNTNIIMKKVNSPESADYNFCKNNY